MKINKNKIVFKKNDLINKILDFDILKSKPLVLLDLGASGAIYEKWDNKIKYKSIIILCDADERKFHYKSLNLYKVIKIKDIISDKKVDEMDFYLTKSPYCSSTLEPDLEELKKWSFYELFEIKKKIRLQTKTLNEILSENKITYIDWFKTDTQGTDLRIFSSLEKNIRDKVLHCEFEPGIMKAYKNEDYFHNIIKFMYENDFWLENMIINGPERINLDLITKYKYNTKMFKYGKSILKTSPGWTNLSFLKEITKDLNERDFIVLFLFSLIEEQYGYCFEILEKSKDVISKSNYEILEENFLEFFDIFYKINKNNNNLKRANIIAKIKNIFKKIGTFFNHLLKK